MSFVSKMGFGLWLNMRPSARVLPPPPPLPPPAPLPEALDCRAAARCLSLLLAAWFSKTGDPGLFVEAVGLKGGVFDLDFRLCSH